jgi:hypothetical protein
MNRRQLLTASACLAASHALGLSAFARAGESGSSGSESAFPVALAGLLRHRHPSEVAADLARLRSRGYTGIWIENDYVRWTLDKDPDQGFDGCWRLFNIFDFTLGSARDLYQRYLRELSQLCAKQDLDIWTSFWVPLPNAELIAYLRQHRPEAIGQAMSDGNPIPTLCTCKAGQGLAVLTEMFEQFLDQFPQVKGVKIATGDNGSAICDSSCPHANGTSIAEHAGNMFGAIDRALHRPQRKARTMLYPWYWGEGYKEAILSQLAGDYLVMTKMEENSHQFLEKGDAGDAIFDDSIVSEQAGADFTSWCKLVGPERIIDMLPAGSGVDDMFFNYPPYPGRLFRRFKKLRSFGVERFLDYECGGHAEGSNEEAVAVFAKNPGLNEDEFLARIAGRIYRGRTAQTVAVEGWREFDAGFGKLPIGLGGTGSPEFSGRFGFAWPMCLATPPVASAFAAKDRWHDVFWFSPYNFFTFSTAPRLQVHFTRVLDHWQRSWECLREADRQEHTRRSRRECIAVEAHVLGAHSVLNWCAAAALARQNPLPRATWAALLADELALTRRFQALLADSPWLWANNCWHPMQTPLHQKGIGFEAGDRDVFAAKARILETALNEAVTNGV